MIIPRKQRINAFVQLGQFLNSFLQENSILNPEDEKHISMGDACMKSSQKNGWFTELEIRRALESILFMLEEDKILKWLNDFDEEPQSSKTIGVISAGNIPAVGFHDFLSVLISGNRYVGKLSEQDQFLIPFFSELLKGIEPSFADFIGFEKALLKNCDAYIATGSNNTARYFQQYFGKYPHIIRKNRTSIAIVRKGIGNTDLEALGKDIFWYYGLGCRNVTKVYFEEGFNTDKFFEAIVPFGYVMDNKKYANNHIYHQTIFLMNKEQLLDNNFLNLRPHTAFTSQVGVLHYEYFNDYQGVMQDLKSKENEIQTIVSPDHTPYGKAQSPELWDYADGVNTLEFLANLALR